MNELDWLIVGGGALVALAAIVSMMMDLWLR